MEKKLYRSRTNRVIWGVCGGLAEYFNIDPVIVRIIAVLLVLLNGVGIIAYIVMAIIVPLEGSKASTPGATVKENVEEMKATAEGLGREIQSGLSKEGRTRAEAHSRGLWLLGLILVVIGIIFLLSSLNLFWWFQWGKWWPLILVAIGLLVIITARRK